MLGFATPRRLFGIAGALILTGLLLTPYDFAAAARTLAAATVGASVERVIEPEIA